MRSLRTNYADASGLLYRRNRHYDPASGQFTQPDPIGLAGGLATYVYGNANPLKFRDPFGLEPCPEEKEDEECTAAEAADGSESLLKRYSKWRDSVATARSISFNQRTCGADDCGIEPLSAVLPLPLGPAGPAGLAGFTKHGINQLISRDGVGVSSRALLDALRNPVQITGQTGGRTLILGENAGVVLNKVGKVITVWARNSASWRIP
jgi:RHS repeat-associated protein